MGDSLFNNNFMLLPFSIQNEHAVSEIVRCNDKTARYGLMLSPAQAQELVETRAQALQGTGRIEFGGGVIDKLIMHFYDSPYLYSQNYVETLHDLIETFYYFKNESMDRLSDDELIEWMKQYFDGRCQGSIELLQNRELEHLARDIRNGCPADQYFSDGYHSDWTEHEEDETDELS